MVVALVKQPIYQQLNEALRGLLGGREFKTGARFLTEREVSQRFGVSRATANKALSNLVSEGILEFKKGIGTFVRGGVLDYDLRSLVSFTGKAAAAGKRPSTRVLAFDQVLASQVAAPIAAALRVRPADALYTIERLRLADGVPVILERRFVVAEFCPGLRRQDVAGSLYALWTGRLRLEIAGADQSIRAVALRGRDAGPTRRRWGFPRARPRSRSVPSASSPGTARSGGSVLYIAGTRPRSETVSDRSRPRVRRPSNSSARKKKTTTKTQRRKGRSRMLRIFPSCLGAFGVLLFGAQR